MIVNVILEKTASNWCAFTPDDIGVIFTTAPSRDEVIESFRAALRSHLEAMLVEGLEPPTVDSLNVQELVAA
jgi:predicted RNase H-like HicB family nuclease